MTAKKKQEEALAETDIAEYNDIQNEIKRLTERKNQLSIKIKTQIKPGNYSTDDYIIDLTQTIGTLNAPIFLRDFPASEFPELYEQTPSTEAIKLALGEDRKEYYTPTLRLSIKSKTKK